MSQKTQNRIINILCKINSRHHINTHQVCFQILFVTCVFTAKIQFWSLLHSNQYGHLFIRKKVKCFEPTTAFNSTTTFLTIYLRNPSDDNALCFKCFSLLARKQQSFKQGNFLVFLLPTTLNEYKPFPCSIYILTSCKSWENSESRSSCLRDSCN